MTNEEESQSSKAKKRTRDICSQYGVTAMTVWRWVRDGRLPQPVKINGRNYWSENVEPLTDEEVAA